jgi:RNA 2',3'-cyclic 3'-phosphodiesterase
LNDVEKPLRLFVAVTVPEAELARIDSATKDLRDRLIGARWAPLENQHVTLKFLGRTPPEKLDDVRDALEDVAGRHNPDEVSVTGLGVFPSVRRVRVLWAGLRDETDLLKAVADDLAATLAPLGYEPEKRPFSAHLTLARFKVPVPVEREMLELDEGSPFEVNAVDLYRSHLSPKGARYEALRSFELGRR